MRYALEGLLLVFLVLYPGLICLKSCFQFKSNSNVSQYAKEAPLQLSIDVSMPNIECSGTEIFKSHSCLQIMRDIIT